MGPDWALEPPKNFEKRVPSAPLFWAAKMAPKLIQDLFKVGSNFGPPFSPILVSLLEQFWESELSWRQDRPRRRLEEPKRAK